MKKNVIKIGLMSCIALIVFLGCSYLYQIKYDTNEISVSIAKSLANEEIEYETIVVDEEIQIELDDIDPTEFQFYQDSINFEEDLISESDQQISNMQIYELNSSLQTNEELDTYAIVVSEDDEAALKSALDLVTENSVEVLQLSLENEVISNETQNLIEKAIESGTLLILDDSHKFLNADNDPVIRLLTETDYQELEFNDNNFYDQVDNYRNKKVVIVPEDYNIIEAVSILIKSNPSLTNEQLLNVIETSLDPVSPLNSQYGRFNLNRALVLIDEMNKIEKIKKLNEKYSFYSLEIPQSNLASNLALNSGTPGLTATNITHNSITWNAQYITTGIWGNRLDMYDFTNLTWTNVTGTYYTQNGAHTSGNLLAGGLYQGSLAYYVDQWYTIDIRVSTKTLNSPSLYIENVTSNSLTLNAKFPADSVYGNGIYVYDLVTNQEKSVTNTDNAANGRYIVSGLVTNRQYRVKIQWYNIDQGWQSFYQIVTVKPQSNHISYSYDTSGQLVQIQDHTGKILAKYTYDLNGNLLSVQKY